MTKISAIVFALILGSSLFAQNVELNEAENIAKNYMFMRRDNTFREALIISEQHVNYSKSGEILSYIFNFEGGGFVIVSGDKQVPPILAYSLTNTFLVDKNHPAYVFLEAYGNAIEQTKTAEVKAEISPKWSALATGKQHKTIINTVEPLLTSSWNQDKYYNALCPSDVTGTAGTPAYDYHVPNGCVALAMAQIMYFHRYPRQGYGNTPFSYQSNYGQLSVTYGEATYDYEAMADVAMGYSDALARLIFHAGVSVKMGYAADGSGAFSEDAQRAFFGRFFYNSSDVIIGGDNTDTISWWKDTIRQSIDKGLPVYYAACKTDDLNENVTDGCHAFVCDGYEINDTADLDKFHFNFGWGGASNGFYTLSEMGDNRGGHYTLSNRIIVNIEPESDTTNFFTGQKTLTATYGSFNDGSGRLNYRNNTNCSWLISPQEGRNIEKIILKISSFSLAEGDTVKIYAGNTESSPLVIALAEKITSRFDTVLSSQALVVFTSDDSLNGEGFTFNYTSEKTSNNYCSSNLLQTKITTKSGSIENGSRTADYDSDNGNGRISSNGRDNACYWAIAPEGVRQVKFAFSQFDLAQGDIIEIYPFQGTAEIDYRAWRERVPELTFSLLDNKPDLNHIYTLSTATALIRFRTDNNLTATGFKLYWEESTGIQKPESNFGLTDLSIYPNPANDVIKVSLTAEKEEELQIRLYDVLGKELYSIPAIQVLGQHEENINISGFSQGLYLLRIRTSQGVITEKILIK
jgi:hypothetical protein